MTDLDDAVTTLMRVAEALESLVPMHGEEPPSEADGCCITLDDAHEHGRELGWWLAMREVHDAFGGQP